MPTNDGLIKTLSKIISQAPFLRLILFIIPGIILETQLNLDRQLYYIIAGVSLLLIYLSFRPYVTGYYGLRLQWLFGMGLLLFCISSTGLLTHKHWQKSVWHGDGKEHTYHVQIIDDAVVKPKTLMFSVKTGSYRTQIYLPKDSASYALRPADSLLIRASFEQTESWYQRSHQIAAFAFVSHWEKIEPIGKQPFNIRFTALKYRRYLLEHLRRIIHEEKEFSVAAALIFGYKANMDKDLQQTFASTGCIHILSVSGLHFSIIYAILYFVFSFLGNGMKSRIIRQAIILLLLWGFAFLTGMPVPVIRAALMLTLWGIGSTFMIRSFNLNTVCVAAFFMLIYNPLNLYDIGFQLSFSAVLSILLIYPHLYSLLSLRNTLLRNAWQLSCVSIAAQAGTTPLSIYYFCQFPVLFLFTNLVAIPITTVLLGLIPVSLALEFIFGKALTIIPVNTVLHIFISVLEWFGSIPNAVSYTNQISVTYIIFTYFAEIFLILFIFRRRLIHLFLLICITIYLIFPQIFGA
ncbi:MAG: ComEC/Rec2 family competence protein [Dysgonamonadaceae bacterium]|jgi:competence protein ComEC|nr:ComEC/Rec2 family competence protein [Dysgonamonadaceae bacterium]